MKYFIRFMLYALLFGTYMSAWAQHTYTITGKVTDKHNHALPGAYITISPIQQRAVSNADGEFTFLNVNAGTYEISASFIGYNEFKQPLVVSNSTHIAVVLTPATLSLQELTVACHHDEELKKEESLSVEIVNDAYIKQNLGGSLMTSLDRLPGVGSMEIGSGQSKPVIRGLGFNRVVVVENGIKHEGQQWGSDHGLEIDQYAVENAEIIKGPSSLMYGSDAIGGVIHLKQNAIPAMNTFGGSVDLTGKSNNNLVGTSVALNGRKNWLYGGIRLTLLDYADYKVPADSVDIYSYKAPLYKNRLRNTAGNEVNYNAYLGAIHGNFQTRFYMSQTNNKSGFFANAHGVEPRNVDYELHDASDRDIHYPYQNVRHFKLANKTQWENEKFRLEGNLGYQRNFRQEWSQYTSHGYMPPVFPDTLSFPSDLERQFDKHYYSGSFHATLLLERWEITAGINGGYQDNAIDGRGFIIPAYKQVDAGAFALAKYELTEVSKLSAGVRYDFGKMHTDAYNDWFPSPIVEGQDTTYQHLQRAMELNRNFSNFSWSLGYIYSPAHWLLKLNVGKSFRMPIAKELAANGVNYHQFSYEVGDPNLDPEISYQLDAGIEYSEQKFAVGVTPFLNYFSNYIYLNPTADHDRLYGNGNQVFEYTQSKVFRFGGEVHAHYEIRDDLQVGILGEYVYSIQLSGEKEGYTLPFSPAPSLILNARYQKPSLWKVKQGYISLDYRLTAAQYNIVPPEEVTEGYQLMNLRIGGDLSIYRQTVTLSMQVQNVLNTKYFNHTSYYRRINVPESGRNFIVNLTIPF